jgi:purine-nucleoside phosphorylase
MPHPIKFWDHLSLTQTARQVVHHFGNDLPETLIITGSGQGAVADLLEKGSKSIKYRNLGTDMRTICSYSKHQGHERVLHMGILNGIHVSIMQGRLHHYEGYKAHEIVLLARTLFALGVKRLVIMNASGITGTNHGVVPGDIVLLKSHMAFGIPSPLRGPNDNMLGPRHPDVSNLYNQSMRHLAREIYAHQHDGDVLKEAVYCALPGPRYDTSAEVDFFNEKCALLGMSTVQTVDAARHMGIELILGISAAVNYGTGVSSEPLSHEDVVAAANKATNTKLVPLIRDLCAEWARADELLAERKARGDKIKPTLLETRGHHQYRNSHVWPNPV